MQIVQAHARDRRAACGHARPRQHQRDAVNLFRGADVLAIQAVRPQRFAVIRRQDDEGIVHLARGRDLIQQATEQVIDLGNGRVVAGRGFPVLPRRPARPRPPGAAVQFRPSRQIVAPGGRQRQARRVVAGEGFLAADEGIVRFQDADEAGPRRVRRQRRLQKTRGMAYVQAAVARVRRQLRYAVEAVRRVARQRRQIPFPPPATRRQASPNGGPFRLDLRMRFRARRRPPEAGELMGAFHVPFAEIPRRVARGLQALGPVRRGAQGGAVVPYRMGDRPHVVIVRQQARHQAGARRGADRTGRIRAGEAQAAGLQAVEVGRLAGVARIQDAALHLIRHQKEQIGAARRRRTGHGDEPPGRMPRRAVTEKRGAPAGPGRATQPGPRPRPRVGRRGPAGPWPRWRAGNVRRTTRPPAIPGPAGRSRSAGRR